MNQGDREGINRMIDGLFQRLIASVAEITRDIRSKPGLIGVLEDQFKLFRHGNA